MPRHDGVRRDDGGYLPGGESLSLCGESWTLIVVQAKASSTKLLFQHSVLFDKVLQHLLLMTVDPRSKRDQEQLAGVQDGSHPRDSSRHQTLIWQALTARRTFRTGRGQGRQRGAHRARPGEGPREDLHRPPGWRRTSGGGGGGRAEASAYTQGTPSAAARWRISCLHASTSTGVRPKPNCSTGSGWPKLSIAVQADISLSASRK